MNKLLAFFLLGFLTFNLLGQRVNKLALKIENDKVFQNNTLFNGQMYELYQSGFLKSTSDLKNGVLEGELKLFTDNSKSFSSYQDSAILKSFEDSLKVYSKLLFEFQKDSAKYDREVSTIFNEEIKTKENLNEWIEKYESGKLNKKKTAIYEELKTASYNLDRARVDLKIIREKNLNCQIQRKKEREKPVYQNVLTDRYEYSNGVKSGKHEIYFKDGKITQQEYYTNDLLNGDFKKFDSYGKLIESGNYSNNQKNGEWKTYDADGKLTKLETFIDNKKNGKYQEFQNDKLVSEGNYKDNLKDGECKSYDYYGKLSALENYKLDKREGISKKYNGAIITEEGQYVGGLMNGEWVFRYDNGNIKGKGKYINGDGSDLGKESKIPINGRDGLWINYHNNGNKSQESNYVNGARNGKSLTYFENGNIEAEVNYFNGKVEGNYNWYYDNGKLKVEGNYISGKKEGIFITYYNSGKIEWKTNYINNSREGLAYKINESGQKIESVFKNDSYEYNGSIQKIYSLDGSISEIKYESGKWYSEETEEEKWWGEHKWKVSLNCMWCNKTFIAENGISTTCWRASSDSQWETTIPVNLDKKFIKYFCSKKCAVEYCDAQ